MGKLAEWLRHVAGILAGKADLIDGVNDKVRAQVSWLKWRYAVVGTVAGFLVGYVFRGM